MDDLALVMASGLDLTDDGQLELSMQIALPTGIAGASQTGGKSQKPFLFVSEKGKTGQEIIGKLQMQLSRRIFFGLRGIIVIGEKYARHGVDQVLDPFMRFPDARYNSFVVTACDTTAKEILNTPYQLENIPIIGVKNILLSGNSVGVKIDEFLDGVAASGRSPVTAGIRIINKGTEQQTYTLDKIAVYSGNKLVGFLSRPELNLFRLWTKDAVALELTTQMEPKSKEFKGTITILAMDVKTKMRTIMKNQVPEVSLTYTILARVTENDTKLDISKENNLHRVETKISNETQKSIANMFSRLQKEFKADIFGLGNEVHVEHPYVWKNIKNKWFDIYPKVPVTVKVDLHIDRIGRTQAPAHAKK